MKITPTDFEGLYLIEPVTHGDARGFFRETFLAGEFAGVAGPVDFMQENESLSRYGVVRGLHWQAEPFAQAKLVRAAMGTVLDVAVDLRPGSATYGRHFAIELSQENGLQVFIPKGFAHGFAVLSEQALFQYKVDAPYAPQCERAVAWNSRLLGIDWRVPPADIILSAKDAATAPFDPELRYF